MLCGVVRWGWLGSGCGVVWCGVVWCGVVWCGVVWCGAVRCGVWCVVVRGVVSFHVCGVEWGEMERRRVAVAWSGVL